MKSGIVTRSDPYLMDPSLLVDPNLILDYGSSFKDEAPLCSYSSDPAWMDLINYDDSQLENIILGDAAGTTTADLCSSFGNPLTPEYDFEEFLKGLELQPQASTSSTTHIGVLGSSVDLTPPLTPVHQPAVDPLSTCIFESGIANFEEVDDYSLKSDWSVQSPASTVLSDAAELDNADAESVQSFSTESSSVTLKRKLKDADDDDEDFTVASLKAPKRARKQPARRNRRVQDARVKNQNKVAAMKYRAKKRDEKSVLDVELEEEEEKNKKLKGELEELKVNIDVLKELLGKYLSPSQLKQK